MSEELLIILGNVLFHAFAKLKQYKQLEENYNSSFKMSCGFSSQVVMIFLIVAWQFLQKEIESRFYCELHQAYALNITSIFSEFLGASKKMTEWWDY